MGFEVIVKGKGDLPVDTKEIEEEITDTFRSYGLEVYVDEILEV